MHRITRPAALLASILLFGPASVNAEETLGTFTLDGLSFISFGDQQILLPETGSSIVFHFGTPAADGAVPFTFSTEDVSIAPITLPSGGGTLHYTIAGSTSGTLEPTAEGRRLSFTATVRAHLADTPGGGSFDYVIPFSTENAQASNAAGTDAVNVAGMRLVDGLWYGQIVGATTNKTNAFPAPGTAVYTVLSGRFDRIP
jgi:hypothetical protein